MDKVLYTDKKVELSTFTNYKGDKMVGIRFIVPESSADNYRGWKVKKAAKIAKVLRKMAKILESL